MKKAADQTDDLLGPIIDETRMVLGSAGSSCWTLCDQESGVIEQPRHRHPGLRENLFPFQPDRKMLPSFKQGSWL